MNIFRRVRMLEEKVLFLEDQKRGYDVSYKELRRFIVQQIFKDKTVTIIKDGKAVEIIIHDIFMDREKVLRLHPNNFTKVGFPELKDCVVS